MDTKHTAGKWLASSMTMKKSDWAALHSGKHNIDIVRRGPDIIAAVWCGDDNDDEEAANARLIAAAPDMLTALLWIADHSGIAHRNNIRSVVLAAIAKAEGRE